LDGAHAAFGDADLDELTFEEALHRLEAIVERLESDAGNLEEALDAYEEGVGIAQECLSRLDDAEQRVSELTLDD
jgi:exodeoxyribonuclease VII small subunit